jgi:hypothetical protein
VTHHSLKTTYTQTSRVSNVSIKTPEPVLDEDDPLLMDIAQKINKSMRPKRKLMQLHQQRAALAEQRQEPQLDPLTDESEELAVFQDEEQPHRALERGRSSRRNMNKQNSSRRLRKSEVLETMMLNPSTGGDQNDAEYSSGMMPNPPAGEGTLGRGGSSRRSSRTVADEKMAALFHKPSPSSMNPDRKRKIFILLCVLIIMAVAIGVSIFVFVPNASSNGSSNGSNDGGGDNGSNLVPTPAPTISPRPTSLEDLIRQTLKDLLQEESPMHQNWEPTQQTLDWLVSFVLLKPELDDPFALLQKGALVSLYNSLGGASWRDSGDWLSLEVDHCDWFGVFCDEFGAVVALTLQDNLLSGKLSREVGFLKKLSKLSLS